MGRKLLWFVVLAGCGGSKASQEDFLTALPTRKQVQIAFPAGSVHSESLSLGSDAVIGRTADFYVVTRITSEHLNGMVGSLLDTLGRITQRPPNIIEEKRAA